MAAMQMLRAAALIERSSAFLLRGGEKWRLAHNQTRSNNEYGSALFSLPDWEYADGRPAPVRASVERAIRRDLRTKERISRLQSEMDVMMEEAWEQKRIQTEKAEQDAALRMKQEEARVAHKEARKAFFEQKLRKKIGAKRL